MTEKTGSSRPLPTESLPPKAGGISAPIRRVGHQPLLARILETPNLAAQVQALPATVLARLVDRIGLEDSGELVALATTAQLAQVLDQDIWRSGRSGQDERFDGDRFLVWLSVMLEAGESVVAERLSELPEDLVTLALHRQILVLDADVLLGEIGGEDGGAIDEALSSCLTEEFERYLLVSRRHDGWDDVFAAVLALDREHHDLLLRILERCRHMTGDQVEQSGGLQRILTAAETLEEDLAGERQDRRAQEGYVAPSDAAGFLRLARETADPVGRDPLTQSYFRRHAQPDGIPLASAAEHPDLVQVLHEAGVVGSADAPRLLGASTDGEAQCDEPLVILAMRRLGEQHPDRFAERSAEIAYLANVLVAGCSLEGRAFTASEAARAVIATCSLGLELTAEAGHEPVEDAVARLREEGADACFRRAWRRMSMEVVRPTAEAAERWLRDAASRVAGIEAQHLLRAAGRVRAASAAATPWMALADLDAMLESVEADVVESLRGLMDECPQLGGCLTGANREAHRGNQPRFISSASELNAAREFLRGFTRAL